LIAFTSSVFHTLIIVAVIRYQDEFRFTIRDLRVAIPEILGYEDCSLMIKDPKCI